METIPLKKLFNLSISDRIQLVFDLWDSIAAFPEYIELTGAQKKELTKRLRDFRKNPRKGFSWTEVKARLVGNNI